MEALEKIFFAHRLKPGLLIYEDGSITDEISRIRKLLGIIIEIDGPRNSIVVDLCRQDAITAKEVVSYMENFRCDYVDNSQIVLLQKPEKIMSKWYGEGVSPFQSLLNMKLNWLNLPPWCNRYFTRKDDYVNIQNRQHYTANEDDMAFIRPVAVFPLY